MDAHEKRIRDLTKEGAVERTELARTAGGLSRWARTARGRAATGGLLAVVGAASAGLGWIAVRAIRRGRARKKRGGFFERLGIAGPQSQKREKKKRRENESASLPVTLLLLLARSAVGRRSVAAVAERLMRPKASPPEEPAPSAEPRPSADRPSGGAGSNGPASAVSRAPSREPGEKGHLEGGERLPAAGQLSGAPLKKKVSFAAELLKQAFAKFREDEALTRGAALAYYTVFSVAPLLVVAIAVAGMVFGADAAQGKILAQIQGMVGPEAAKTLQTMIAKANKPSANIVATVLGVATLLLGAGGVFGNLQESLNKIWGVATEKSGGILKMVKDRFLSLAMVLGTGFLLLVSLVISAALAAVGGSLGKDLPPALGFLLGAVHALFSWGVIGVLFAMIFKFLPDTKIAWKDVWIGGAITSALFALGQFLIGLYIGRSSVSSVYAGAASLAIILIWAYYSALILFYGAEITEVYASRWGSKTRQLRAETGKSSR